MAANFTNEKQYGNFKIKKYFPYKANSITQEQMAKVKNKNKLITKYIYTRIDDLVILLFYPFMCP